MNCFLVASSKKALRLFLFPKVPLISMKQKCSNIINRFSRINHSKSLPLYIHRNSVIFTGSYIAVQICLLKTTTYLYNNYASPKMLIIAIDSISYIYLYSYILSIICAIVIPAANCCCMSSFTEVGKGRFLHSLTFG